jgi:hypothetical protein
MECGRGRFGRKPRVRRPFAVELYQPLPISAVALLLLNDHVGKSCGLLPGVVTSSSHMDDDLLASIPPHSSIGLNIGWTMLVPKSTSVGYAELQLRPSRTYAVAPGWEWDPVSNHNGPQTTFSLGPFYLRVGYLIHTRFDLSVGVFFKSFLSWIWSR